MEGLTLKRASIYIVDYECFQKLAVVLELYEMNEVHPSILWKVAQP